MADLIALRRHRIAAARARAAALGAAHGHLDAPDLLAVMIEREFPGDIAVASSFGAEAVALLALAADVDRHLPVIFLDTGKLFPETLAYRDEVAGRLGLSNVRVAGPQPDELAAADGDGARWSRDPDGCCMTRKVVPLVRAVAPFGAWITGRKRYQGGQRGELQPIEASDGWVKVNPLARWTKQDVFRFIAQRGLPRHPLLEQGYMSIGCQPCTRPVAPIEDERDGRWSGSAKTECGIHTLVLDDDGPQAADATVAAAR